MVYQWTKKLQSWLLPWTCLLCGAPGDKDHDLCPGCHAALPLNRYACQCCGIPLGTRIELPCGQCQRHPPPFQRTFAPLLYQPPVDYLLKELKFHHQLTVARLLGDWLGEMLVHRQTPLPECIIPVPLHPARLRERGFNQALELARPIARRCNIPLVTKAVRRIRHTTPQVQLDLKARRGNVRGAFSANQMVLSRHVAVIDDVITTGNTITEVARVLRSAGVEEIEVWSCARTAQAATS